MLEYFERSNLFVVALDDGRHWYRYHHLFADLLRQRLRREKPHPVPELHQRGSGWYEREGLIAEAVGHALTAEHFERATRVIDLSIPCDSRPAAARWRPRPTLQFNP
jgi:LuxR family maltose regulon positive regulatory protein